METHGKKENELDAVLKDVYDSVEPVDSWEALRGRIDSAISSADCKRPQRHGWPMAAAACILVGLSVLCYQVGIKSGESRYRDKQLSAGSADLFTDVRLSQLQEAFSQVRPLFAGEMPWIMVGEGNDVQIGLNGQSAGEVDTEHIVVVRLAVNMEGAEGERQNYDIVTFANRRAELLLPLVADVGVHVRLVPRLSADGVIDVEIDASINGGAHTRNTGRIADDSFISLVRMETEKGWLNIDGTGRAVSGS